MNKVNVPLCMLVFKTQLISSTKGRINLKVLQTGQEINEVDQSGFSTQGSTVFAGNLGANRYIVQVTQMGVRLLQDIEQVYTFIFI